MTPDELRVQVASRILLLDGAMGTMLIAAGLEAGRAPECWTLDHPDRIARVHSAYVEAGCDVVLTNTFGASPSQLLASGLDHRCEEVNRRAVEIARQASAGRALVAGDMGPSGLLLPPLGEAREDKIEDGFRVQASSLASAGADFLVVETMFDLREAQAAVRAACETGLATVASMTFVSRPRGFYSVMGNPIVDSLQALADAGAVAVGCNCSVSSAEMVSMVRVAKDQLPGPFIAQPNAGPPRGTAQGVVYDASEEIFAADLAAMSGLGARLVGGCCGTTPAFIRRARVAIDACGVACTVP
jgi:5-methyltetrahydrofolate--homocysteine methyltransferase